MMVSVLRVFLVPKYSTLCDIYSLLYIFFFFSKKRGSKSVAKSAGLPLESFEFLPSSSFDCLPATYTRVCCT